MQLPAPLNPIEFYTSEDAPLLSDTDLVHPHFYLHNDEHLHMDQHSDFEVAPFPTTPMLPSIEEARDDDFSDFVESPASEVPPEVKIKSTEQDVSSRDLADLFSLEWIQHVAIIIAVQLLIPIPFMVPMGINFMKRALKVFAPGFVVGLVGHTIYNAAHATPTEQHSPLHLLQSLPAPSSFIPAFFTQLKVGALGGIVIGAIIAHVLNLVILGHTICRLVRRLEPEPSLMRRAMDSSKTFQRTRRVVLDLITGLGMMPAGVVGRRVCYGIVGKTVVPVDINLWHAAATGLVGAIAVQLFILTRHTLPSAGLNTPRSKGRGSSPVAREVGI